MYKSLPIEKMKTNLTYEKTLFLSFEFNVSKTSFDACLNLHTH